MTIALIRNAGTSGGLEGRLLGLKDEPVAPQCRERLTKRIDGGAYPDAQMVFTGGLIRCIDTARSIYPYRPCIVLDELRAFDLGVFSGMTGREIENAEEFPGFLDGCIKTPPGGSEDPYVFLSRCGLAFSRISREAQLKNVETVSVVTHLAVIRAILRRYHLPRSPYRDWNADFCGGYICDYGAKDGMLRLKGEI